MTKTECRIGNVIPHHISTSRKRELRNNIDVTDYSAGDYVSRPDKQRPLLQWKISITWYRRYFGGSKLTHIYIGYRQRWYGPLRFLYWPIPLYSNWPAVAAVSVFWRQQSAASVAESPVPVLVRSPLRCRTHHRDICSNPAEAAAAAATSTTTSDRFRYRCSLVYSRVIKWSSS